MRAQRHRGAHKIAGRDRVRSRVVGQGAFGIDVMSATADLEVEPESAIGARLEGRSEAGNRVAWGSSDPILIRPEAGFEVRLTIENEGADPVVAVAPLSPPALEGDVLTPARGHGSGTSRRRS
ncbi:hypothetical protein [Rubrivirga sp.]|uniref:hypothetical protein n=1 Tax=Rubrivirga sp. TaxID=1885344 RepID=UPI003C73FEE7